MSRKSSKIGLTILFGVVAGATFAGVYHYLKNKETVVNEFDDFDDLDIPAGDDEEKNYISLDAAKVFVNDTFDKAKDVISKASKKIQDTAKEYKEAKEAEVEELFEDDDFDNFDDDLSVDDAVDDAVAEGVSITETKAADSEEESKESVIESVIESEDADDSASTTEEFFDDDDEA